MTSTLNVCVCSWSPPSISIVEKIRSEHQYLYFLSFFPLFFFVIVYYGFEIIKYQLPNGKTIIYNTECFRYLQFTFFIVIVLYTYYMSSISMHTHMVWVCTLFSSNFFFSLTRRSGHITVKCNHFIPVIWLAFSV